LPLKIGSFLNTSGIFFLFLIAIFFRIIISGRIFPSSNYLFIILFGILVILRLPGKARGLWLSRSEQACLLIFFGALGLSAPLGIYPSASLRELVIFFQFLLILLATVRWTGPERIPSVLLIMILAGLISVAMALRQYFGGFESTLAQIEGADLYLVKTLMERRVFGFTFSPDMLAGLLAMLIPLCLGLAGAALKSPQMVSRSTLILISTPALILLAGLLLTRSLGGWLAGILGIGIFFMSSRSLGLLSGKDRIRFRAKILLASASVIVLVTAFSWFIHTRGAQFLDFSSRNNPVLLRILNWKASALVYKERPFFGVGLGNLGLAYPRHRPLKGNEIQYAHNNFLQILVEAGPLGLLGILGLASLFLFLAWKQPGNKDPGQTLIFRGIFAGGAVFLAHSLIDFDLYAPEVSSVFWILFGLLVVSEESAGKEQIPEPKSSAAGKWLPWLLALVLLLLMAGSAYLYLADRDLKKAANLIQEGKHSEAKNALRRHLKWDQKTDKAHLLLARALRLGQGPSPEVIQEYRLAQALNPHYSFYHQELGDYFLEKGWPQAAEKEYRKAIELYPNNYQFNLQLALVLLRQKNLNEAEAVLRHATECSLSNYDAWLNLAQLYLDQDRYNKAQEILERLANKFPKNQPAWFLLWQMYKEQGDEASADRVLKEIQSRFSEGSHSPGIP
jgi:Tfp pilus assembly protein PilF/O-antigen ligase